MRSVSFYEIAKEPRSCDVWTWPWRWGTTWMKALLETIARKLVMIWPFSY